MKLLKKINGKHTGLFAAGLLLGTAGVKILSSKDAKNVYTKCTAAVNEDRKAQETSYADESQTEE